MSIFRFDRNSAPTRDQTGRFIIGQIDEERSGVAGEIVLVGYPEAFRRKDNREGIRILFTGSRDKQKAFKEVTSRMHRYDQERCFQSADIH